MPHSVLVIDDQPAMREVVRDVLELSGCQVCEASGAEEAFDMLSSAPVQVVVCAGAQAVEDLRRRGVDLRIVSVSSREGCCDAKGADACLVVPFSAKELMGAVSG